MEVRKVHLNSAKQLIEIEKDSDIRANFIGRKCDSFKGRIIFTHLAQGIHSKIRIKVVLFDEASFELEALIRIEKGAKATDTYLKINCLVVGEKAYAKVIPGLEILEDDVRAGHGATIGALDEQELFYLESRGLTKTRAQKVLIEAFMRDD